MSWMNDPSILAKMASTLWNAGIDTRAFSHPGEVSEGKNGRHRANLVRVPELALDNPPVARRTDSLRITTRNLPFL
jgi:hypothetical protein